MVMDWLKHLKTVQTNVFRNAIMSLNHDLVIEAVQKHYSVFRKKTRLLMSYFGMTIPWGTFQPHTMVHSCTKKIENIRSSQAIGWQFFFLDVRNPTGMSMVLSKWIITPI